jgi:hypothetical protein
LFIGDDHRRYLGVLALERTMPLSDQVVSPNLDIVADIEREMVALLALRRAI